MKDPYNKQQLAMIRALAHKKRNYIDDPEDLYGHIVMVYCKAIKSWNGKGNKIAWAMWKVKKAIIDYLRNNGKISRSGIIRPTILHLEDLFKYENQDQTDLPDKLKIDINWITNENYPLSNMIKNIIPGMPLIDQYVYDLMFVQGYGQYVVFDHILQLKVKTRTKGIYYYWFNRIINRFRETIQWMKNVHKGSIESRPIFELSEFERNFKVPKLPLVATRAKASIYEVLMDTLRQREENIDRLGAKAFEKISEDMKRALVNHSLERCEGNQSKAAKKIGASRNTVRTYSNWKTIKVPK